jgi:hypothetical protein
MSKVKARLTEKGNVEIKLSREDAVHLINILNISSRLVKPSPAESRRGWQYLSEADEELSQALFDSLTKGPELNMHSSYDYE